VTLLAATSGPTWFWYFTRATGIVALILLSAIMVLGILGPLRASSRLWPRFAVDAVHRDLSLLALLVIVIHVVTTVLDGYAPISLAAAVIPFDSSYRPLWLGLGAVAFDLMLAVMLTSVIRRRLGYRAWRGVHWLAYASWPVAVAHGIGTGSDAAQGWALAVTFACVVAVVIAVLVRVVRATGIEEGTRSVAIAAVIVVPLALAIFTAVGPLASNWAQRAGTPTNLIGSSTR
jgi:methionine sulfoxide reductase heme-binding subunit